eukprot:5031332-Pyramimonas_sp.AAC.1
MQETHGNIRDLSNFLFFSRRFFSGQASFIDSRGRGGVATIFPALTPENGFHELAQCESEIL